MHEHRCALDVFETNPEGTVMLIHARNKGMVVKNDNLWAVLGQHN